MDPLDDSRYETPTVDGVAGWHRDPDGTRRLRWWDGHRWSDSTSPARAPEPDHAEIAGIRDADGCVLGTFITAVHIQLAFDEVFDFALVYHAFTDYMRDYEVVTYIPAGRVGGVAARHLRYVFRHCVEAHVTSAVRPDVWKQSLDDRFVNGGWEREEDLAGFVWGVRWQNLYPGARLIAASTRAASWASSLELPFFEARIETEAQTIEIVFAELQVLPAAPGYRPFEVEDETIPGA